MRMGVVFAAAALTVTAGIAGCGGSAGSPQALPSLSPAASASPSPSPVPTGVQAPTAQGAADFARNWYAQIEKAFATKDPGLVEALSAPGCETCARYIASLKKLRQNNERATGATFKLIFAEAPAVAGDTADVSVMYDAPEAIRYDSAGNVIRREPAMKGVQEQVVLRRSGTSWLVVEVQG
jgi:hypothetical protein